MSCAPYHAYAACTSEATVWDSEEDQCHYEAEIVAGKECVAKIAKGNDEDAGSHHQGGM